MFNFIKRNAILMKGALSLLGLFILALGLSSCDDNIIYEKPDPNCHYGIDLRLVYQYHLEPGANSFPANVDCVSVLVFDNEGNYLKTFSETTDILKDENYRMHLPLDKGTYQLYVYGGLTCEHPTFNFSPDWLQATKATGTPADIKVTLPLDENGESNKLLHNMDERTGGLFYGAHTVTITDDDWQIDHRTETVYLMKDTNNIQVILQELAYPSQIDYNDYDFRIVDDNFVLDGNNKAVSIATDDFQPQYRYHAAQNRIAGYIDGMDGNHGDAALQNPENLVQVACVEFSTSRLFWDPEHVKNSRLIITSKKEKDKQGNYVTIIDIPLITYLTATMGFGNQFIKGYGPNENVDPDKRRVPMEQEYLDRQSNWTLMFFLQKNVWVSVRVVVNGWIVRENNIVLDY